MSDEPKKRERGPVSCVLLAALALYAASLGPAALLAKVSHTRIDEHRSAYAPIFWLSRQSSVAHEIIESYMRDWATINFRANRSRP
jgi:hypothetical protein